jgi:hypothetical protein
MTGEISGMARTVNVSFDSATKALTRSVTREKADGQEVTRTTTRSKSEDGYVKDVTVSGRERATGSRTVESSRDAETQTTTREVSVEGNNHDYTRALSFATHRTTRVTE